MTHKPDDLPRPDFPPPFEPPALMDDDTFRATPTYASLCGQFGQDPEMPWGLMKFDSLTAAAEFLCLYHRAKADLAPWSASQVAAYYEALTLAHEPDRGGLVWADRHGHVLVVIDPRGRPRDDGHRDDPRPRQRHPDVLTALPDGKTHLTKRGEPP